MNDRSDRDLGKEKFEWMVKTRSGNVQEEIIEATRIFFKLGEAMKRLEDSIKEFAVVFEEENPTPKPSRA